MHQTAQIHPKAQMVLIHPMVLEAQKHQRFLEVLLLL
jgi:hypothetical protein